MTTWCQNGLKTLQSLKIWVYHRVVATHKNVSPMRALFRKNTGYPVKVVVMHKNESPLGDLIVLNLNGNRTCIIYV